MREIKFRGKRISNGKWLYGDLMHDTVGGCYVFPIDCAALYKENAVLPETIGQYTGLRDKNGKEVYEGDILRGDEYPFNCDCKDNYFAKIVRVDNLCGFYRITLKNPKSTVRGFFHGKWEQLDEDDIKSFEVIGNIYDNKNLLGLSKVEL